VAHGEELFGLVYERGTIVFHQGDPGDTMYVVQSGAVEVSRLQGDRDVVLAVLERGDFFGEMALLDDHPRSATVTAIRRTRLLPLTRTSLLERVRQDPGVALHLLKALSHRIEQTDRLLRNLVEGDETLRTALEASRDEAAGPAAAPGGEPLAPARELGGCLREVADFCLAHEECLEAQPGQVIFRQDEPGQGMYIIAQGLVEITQETEGGTYVLATLGPNDFFGEMALISSQPRSATARAITPARLLPIRGDQFLERVKVQPELALYILQVMVKRLRLTLGAMSAPEESLEAVRRSLPPLLLKKDGKVTVASPPAAAARPS
jgi:CRP-like cAMP-binding protein